MTEWYDSYIWNFYYFKSDFQVVISFSIYLEACYLIWQVRASTEKCYMCVFLTIRHQHECLLHTPGIWLFSNKNSEPWAIQLLLLYIFVMLTINTKLNCLHLVILLIGVVSICVGCARIWDMLLWVMKWAGRWLLLLSRESPPATCGPGVAQPFFSCLLTVSLTERRTIHTCLLC